MAAGGQMQCQRGCRVHCLGSLEQFCAVPWLESRQSMQTLLQQAPCPPRSPLMQQRQAAAAAAAAAAAQTAAPREGGDRSALQVPLGRPSSGTGASTSPRRGWNLEDEASASEDEGDSGQRAQEAATLASNGGSAPPPPPLRHAVSEGRPGWSRVQGVELWEQGTVTPEAAILVKCMTGCICPLEVVDCTYRLPALH